MIFHLRSFAIISALTVPISALAQIPVTITSDIPATLNQVQTMAQWTQQIAGMKQQYDQMQTDYQQMVRQYESTTGSRDLGQIMNDPKLRNYLPNDWQDVYDSVKKSGYSGLSGSAKSIYENNQAYDGCAHIVSELERTSCEARSVKGAQDKGFALKTAYSSSGNPNSMQRAMHVVDGFVLGQSSSTAVENSHDHHHPSAPDPDRLLHSTFDSPILGLRPSNGVHERD